MKIMYSTDTLLFVVSQGMMSLQIPEYEVVYVDGEPIEKKNNLSEQYPIDWFQRLWNTPRGFAIPKTKRQEDSPNTHCYLSEKGFHKNKKELQKAFEFSLLNGYNQGQTWKDFEKMALKHYEELKTSGISKSTL